MFIDNKNQGKEELCQQIKLYFIIRLIWEYSYAFLTYVYNIQKNSYEVTLFIDNGSQEEKIMNAEYKLL